MPRNRRLQYQTATQPVFVPPESITEDKWHSPWSEPVRKKISGRLAVAIIASGVTLTPVVPSPGTANAAVDSPTAFEIIDRRVVIYPAYQGPVPIVVEAITEDKWHQKWSEPVRQKIDPRLSVALGSSGEIYVRPLIVQEDKWHQPWSEPVRQKINPRLLVALGSSGEIYTRPLITQEDKWHQPWSEPVRLKRGLRSDFQQSIAFTSIPIEQIFEDKWHQPWPLPVRTAPRLITGANQFLALDPFPLPNPVVEATEASWHYPWSDPVRVKINPRLAAALIASGNTFNPFAIPNTGTATSAVDSPVSFEILDRRVLIYPSYQGPPPTVVAEVITEDKWHQAWSEPVRTRRWLQAALQQALIFNPQPPEVITEDKWHRPWSEPVRQRPKILAYQQQALVTTLRPIEIITEDKWHFPWSQPVQFKRDPRYLATLAASGGVIYPFPLPPVVIVFEDRWHQPWSEPVRLKIGPRLRAALQQFTTIPPEIISGGAITGILDATEQGDIFYATGLLFNQVAGGNVGIIELVPGSARVGLQFDKPTVSANVGIETSITSAQSGTVISSSFSAIVSVRKA